MLSNLIIGLAYVTVLIRIDFLVENPFLVKVFLKAL